MRKRVLARLFVIAAAASAGLLEPSSALLAIPESIAVGLVDDEELAPEHRRGVLGLLAKDPRAPVRERVARAAGSASFGAPASCEAILSELSDDPYPAVRARVAEGLTSLVERALPMERLELISRWTLSSKTGERRAVARALRAPIPMFVSDLALGELARDPAPEVRSLAACALGRRFAEDRDGYASLLAGLAADSDQRVAKAARRVRAALGINA